MKPRVGLLALYFDMFDEVMPASFRQEKEAVGREVVQLLETFADVDYPGLVANAEQATEAGKRWADFVLDAIVIFPTMASPPAYTWDCVSSLEMPLILWNGHLTREIEETFTYQDANRYSGPVGTIMISNVFLRENHPFQLIGGYYRDGDTLNKVKNCVVAASAARRLRRARIGRIGREVPGYTDVVLDGEAVRDRLGLRLVDVERSDLEEHYRQVGAKRVKELTEAIRQQYRVEVESEILATSARIALTLEDVCNRHGLNAAAVNCHSDFFRQNPMIGMTACYGASRLTEMGIPVSCTGDVVTSIAMLALKLLGGGAHYCECVAVDQEKDYVLLTNTGEGDPTLCREDCPKVLIGNEHYPGLHGCGASPFFPIENGEATMVAFSPRRGSRGGHAFALASGEILPLFHEQTTVSNAAFRFANWGCIEGLNQWCLAGAPHHGAVTVGDLRELFRYFTQFLGCELHEV